MNRIKPFDTRLLDTIRADFPMLSNTRNRHVLCYFDNAATTHKPQRVINALSQFYAHHNAPVARGIYTLAEQATTFYEHARTTVQHFIGAQNSSEIIFTSGATEGINFVAYAWALNHVQKGDTIVLTELEHHANILPWQNIAQQKNARLVFIPITSDGNLDYSQIDTLINHTTKLVSVTHISNAIGTTIDMQAIIKRARSVGACILLDASQSVPHKRINLSEIDVDFLVFSGHKMLGPTGIGVLYIKKSVQEQLSPYQRGGGMVFSVSWHDATWLKSPHKFEAGTPPIAQAIGLAAAAQYLDAIDSEALHAHESYLCSRLIDGLLDLSGIRVLGPIDQLRIQGHLVSFTIDNIHAHDIAAYLDQKNICVRAGHHCAQPLAHACGYTASVRASFYLYNTPQEVDLFIQEITNLIRLVKS